MPSAPLSRKEHGKGDPSRMGSRVDDIQAQQAPVAVSTSADRGSIRSRVANERIVWEEAAARELRYAQADDVDAGDEVALTVAVSPVALGAGILTPSSGARSLANGQIARDRAIEERPSSYDRFQRNYRARRLFDDLRTNSQQDAHILHHLLPRLCSWEIEDHNAWISPGAGQAHREYLSARDDLLFDLCELYAADHLGKLDDGPARSSVLRVHQLAHVLHSEGYAYPSRQRPRVPDVLHLR